MGRNAAFILFPPPAADGPWPWRIGIAARDDAAAVHDVPPSSPDDAAEPLAAVAAEVARALEEFGYRGEPVVLALPSTWCMAASIPAGDLPARRRRPLLLFRLEEYLPLPAEAMAVDFVEPDGAERGADPSARVLGVAAETLPLARLIDALTELGVSIGWVCPAALLAAQSDAPATEPFSIDALVWTTDDGAASTADVVTFAGGVPTTWALVRSAPSGLRAALAAHLGAMRTASTTPPEWRGRFVGAGELPLEDDVRWTRDGDEPLDLAATRTAALVVQHRLKPWIDLLRDPRAQTSGGLPRADRWRAVQRPLIATACAAIALLASATCALWLDARWYNRTAAALIAEQGRVCEIAVGRPPPPGLTARTRLASEARRLAATSDPGAAGGSGEHQSLPPQPSILRSLVGVLATIGGDPHRSGGSDYGVTTGRTPRYRLLELQLAPDRLLMEGQSRSHGDADELAAGLRRSLGDRYLIDAPHTQIEQRTAETAVGGPREVVDFSITGQPAPTPPAVAAGGQP